jgi:hypothetical protein
MESFVSGGAGDCIAPSCEHGHGHVHSLLPDRMELLCNAKVADANTKMQNKITIILLGVFILLINLSKSFLIIKIHFDL